MKKTGTIKSNLKKGSRTKVLGIRITDEQHEVLMRMSEERYSTACRLCSVLVEKFINGEITI